MNKILYDEKFNDYAAIKIARQEYISMDDDEEEDMGDNEFDISKYTIKISSKYNKKNDWQFIFFTSNFLHNGMRLRKRFRSHILVLLFGDKRFCALDYIFHRQAVVAFEVVKVTNLRKFVANGNGVAKRRLISRQRFTHCRIQSAVYAVVFHR